MACRRPEEDWNRLAFDDRAYDGTDASKITDSEYDYFISYAHTHAELIFRG